MAVAGGASTIWPSTQPAYTYTYIPIPIPPVYCRCSPMGTLIPIPMSKDHRHAQCIMHLRDHLTSKRQAAVVCCVLCIMYRYIDMYISIDMYIMLLSTYNSIHTHDIAVNISHHHNHYDYRISYSSLLVVLLSLIRAGIV